MRLRSPIIYQSVSISIFTILKKLLPLLLVLMQTSLAIAQPKQTIRGRVVDKEAKYPLAGARVYLGTPSSSEQTEVTDQFGNFRIANVPVGRQSVRLSMAGYKEVLLQHILVDSGKETILNVEMEEAITLLEGFTVKIRRNGEASNEMAVTSARQFSVEETNRYAGSRGEPARMASNFAGVQGSDDSRTDIIVRGNSPGGVLWRMEGVTIPNPNHFTEAGSSGGPVGIITNHYLANSDFFTGAFPAEFGNTVAGVFDLKLRNGNNEKYETGAQFGFMGTEFISEGPISKKNKSSYLITGRYANLWLFNKIGIDIGTVAVPKYADGFVRLNFPLRNGNIAFWSLGGTSNIDVLPSTQKVSDRNIFGQNDRDQQYATNMKVMGLTYSRSFSENMYFKSTLAVSNNTQYSKHTFLFTGKDADGRPEIENNYYKIDSLRPLMAFKLSETKYSFVNSINKKWGAQSTLRAGINLDFFDFSANDSVRIFVENIQSWTPWRVRSNASSKNILYIQPFIQLRHYLTPHLSLNIGVTSFASTVNKHSQSWAEPRGGLLWELPHRQKVTLSAGLHSQAIPNYLYFISPDLHNPGSVNSFSKDVGLMKSAHYVAGYSKILTTDLRISAEIYYQRLFRVPVYAVASSFSVLNTVDGDNRLIPAAPMINNGKGENYGLELTLEKFFSNHYSFLVTASLFEAKYQGSDKIWRNTNVNARYAINGLFGREFIFRNGNSLHLGVKYNATGGRWYGPVDAEASREQQEIIYIDATRNSAQFRPYKRFDIKTEYKINKTKLTHTIAVDLVNILGIQNQLNLSYTPEAPYFRQEYQLGFIPVFFYRIDF